MPKYSIRPFDEAMFDQGVDLLAECRKKRRVHFPSLQEDLDEPAAAVEILKKKGRGSAIASQDGRLMGFLFADWNEDPIWGNSVTSDLDSWVCSPGLGIDTLARLYAEGVSAQMRGPAEHIIHCPAYDLENLDAWFHLGFGIQQAYAVTRLEDIRATPINIPGLFIRQATRNDEEILAELSPLIATMQAQAPIWAGAPPAYLERLKQGFKELPEDENAIVLIAFIDDRPVGYQALFPMTQNATNSEMEKSVELAVSAVIPEERGKGIGVALTALAAEYANKAGYSICYTDWRTANPLSSTFWVARGFSPYAYRLARRI